MQPGRTERKAKAVQDGRIAIELINLPFLSAGGSPDEYRAGLETAIAKGWLWKHEPVGAAPKMHERYGIYLDAGDHTVVD